LVASLLARRQAQLRLITTLQCEHNRLLYTLENVRLLQAPCAFRLSQGFYTAPVT
jgi:hypothetical protein